MSISDNIMALMNENKLTRYKLSKVSGVPYTTLTQILNGRTKDPQVAALQKIADYFDIPLDYITSNEFVPEWATDKDRLDFKVLLDQPLPIMFDGVPIDDDDRERISRVLEGMFWDMKKSEKD